ncbi:MAG TPA: hypothetical protein VNA28_13970 [Solirubrobacteraceae bacterium]|nr:hypothetical protein [Solirubrobacteraceae bacterium]
MKQLISLLLALVAGLAAAPAPAAAPGFEGRRCTPPVGHRIADCRIGRHGTPDLSRAAWHALRGAEVTIGVKIESIAPNLGAGGARSWPLIDSLAQPMGTLETQVDGTGFTLLAVDGKPYRVTSVRMRGRGCAASLDQQARFALFQIIGKSPTGGGQAFVDTAALDQATPSGRAALAAFRGQRGGGTGCGPAGREVGKLRRLANPRVGKTAHARLSDGTINGVTEYDAKPEFGNTVYFMSNTTQVSVGGIARGMVRVGTPVAKVDSFARCDPSSDGTLTWRYWSIRTGIPGRPRLYGWIPANCPARMR